MIKEKAMELVAALRSGKYTQGQSFLHAENGDMCCLGVACALSKVAKRTAAPEPCESETPNSLLVRGLAYKYDDAVAVLPQSVRTEFGFAEKRGMRNDMKMLKIGSAEYTSLAHANDKGVQFPPIADYIEANWEQL